MRSIKFFSVAFLASFLAASRSLPFNPDAAQGTMVMCDDEPSFYRVRIEGTGMEAQLTGKEEGAIDAIREVLRQAFPPLGLRDWMHFGLLYGPDAIKMPDKCPLNMHRVGNDYEVRLGAQVLGILSIRLPEGSSTPFYPIAYEALPVTYPIPAVLGTVLRTKLPAWAPFPPNQAMEVPDDRTIGILMTKDYGELRLIKFFREGHRDMAHLLIGERALLKQLRTELKAREEEIGDLESWCLADRKDRRLSSFPYELRKILQGQVAGVQVWTIHPRDGDGWARAAFLAYPEDGSVRFRRRPNDTVPGHQHSVKRDSIFFLLGLLLLAYTIGFP